MHSHAIWDAWVVCFFFFNDTATTEIYTLSLHDALPISPSPSNVPTMIWRCTSDRLPTVLPNLLRHSDAPGVGSLSEVQRSEEHTSELQSRSDLVCRLLLEKKKTIATALSPAPFTSTFDH